MYHHFCTVLYCVVCDIIISILCCTVLYCDIIIVILRSTIQYYYSITQYHTVQQWWYRHCFTCVGIVSVQRWFNRLKYTSVNTPNSSSLTVHNRCTYLLTYLVLSTVSWTTHSDNDTKGSSIKDVCSEGRGFTQMWTNVNKGRGDLTPCGRPQVSFALRLAMLACAAAWRFLSLL